MCKKYEQHAAFQMQHNKAFAWRIRQLAQKSRVESLNLICWCAPQRCHGDTIKRLIEAELAKE